MSSRYPPFCPDWHFVLLEIAQHDNPDLAEYQTHRQLALDGNLPGEERAEHARAAYEAAKRIVKYG